MGEADAPLGVAVLGSSGHAARVAAPTVAAAPCARLAGVLGSAPGRAAGLAGRHGVPAFDTLDELLEDAAVEAVWITAPNHLHAPLATACLDAGRHVLLEKPMATTHADATALAAAAARSDAQLRIGFHHRFRAAHRWLRDELGAGRFGELRVIRVHRFWRFPYYPDMSLAALADSWRMSPTNSGGWILNDLGSHLVDLVIWLADAEVVLSRARAANLRFNVPVEDTAVLVLDIADRGVGLIDMSNAVASFPSVVEVHGTAGWARADGTFDDGGTVLTSDGEKHDFRLEPPEVAYAAQLVSFTQLVREGTPGDGADAVSAAANVTILEAAVATGR